MEELANKLVDWIRERVFAANKSGVVLGLSGGIDSAVVAALCKRAFPDTTTAAIMPCYSNKMDIVHAYKVATSLKINTELIELEPAYDALIKVLPRNTNYTNDKLAQANIKPRLRMISLYYLATQLNSIVVGTGNRSEIAIGYYTKYGDGGVDILPIGNLVKKQVSELARYLGVPEEIIGKPPSAGLWEGQTDEGEMGLKYEELDNYLTTGKAKDVVRKKIEVMSTLSAHKRAMPQIPLF